ncbi:unnamed protein product [Amoebophrya sp. A25]|nr:unnamed protein product [Amoebophrya sp. A25]|eukprot:GSA25T00011948001.1
MDVELVYFKGGGRATPARVALFNAFGEAGWRNTMLEFQEFSEEQKKWRNGEPSILKTPLGHLPQLIINEESLAPAEEVVTQAPAIARWAGRLGSKPLIPTDSIKSLLCEEIMAVCDDALSKVPSDPDVNIHLRTARCTKRMTSDNPKGQISALVRDIESKCSTIEAALKREAVDPETARKFLRHFVHCLRVHAERLLFGRISQRVSLLEARMGDLEARFFDAKHAVVARLLQEVKRDYMELRGIGCVIGEQGEGQSARIKTTN